jgi:proteasome lid subunit RPN8/RPN11
MQVISIGALRRGMARHHQVALRCQKAAIRRRTMLSIKNPGSMTCDTDTAGLHVEPDAIRIRRPVLDVIAAHAHEVKPQECCGLLLGSAEMVEHVYRARNVRQSPTEYLVAPEDHFAALRFARSHHIEVVGAYHSHPRGPAGPSETDTCEAQERFLYLIVSGLDNAQPRFTAWRLASGNFYGIPLVPVP